VEATGYALDQDGGELLVFGEIRVLLKATAAGTGGACTIWEELSPLLDTPLHVHEHEDEVFHVLDGDHVFRCGDEEYEIGPGGFTFLPRGTPHAHRRVVPGSGRLLVMAFPGGFDGFFRRLADAHQAGTLGPETYAEASAQHGITWLA
jgi:mannose-6-phosphate isomerase-like protein (cupin superfamily)